MKSTPIFTLFASHTNAFSPLQQGIDPSHHQHLTGENALSIPSLVGENRIDLGNYQRAHVSNVDDDEQGRAYFDLGLRLMLSYQHEMAAKCFLACLFSSPNCALAHGLVALCHSPNYNFKGHAYYQSTCHFEDVAKPDLLCVFPSQQVADRHSKLAVDKVEELRRMHRSAPGKRKKAINGKKIMSEKQKDVTESTNQVASGKESRPAVISDVESLWLAAIRVLACCPGINPDLSQEAVGRPYADAMRLLYQKNPDDPDVAYVFAESLMVLNAWQLYEYPCTFYSLRYLASWIALPLMARYVSLTHVPTFLPCRSRKAAEP
jgi:hypothetical protein